MGLKRTTALVYQHIEVQTRKAQRELRRPAYPYEIQARLPFDRAEGSLRRDMLAMSRMGRLVRVGGDDARQGYRMPTELEKLAFRLNGGVWPWGAEKVMVWAS